MIRKLIIQVIHDGTAVDFTSVNNEIRINRVDTDGTVGATITLSDPPDERNNGIVIFEMDKEAIYSASITDAYRSGWFQIQYTLDAQATTPTWESVEGWNPGYFDVDPLTYKEIQDLKSISSLITTQYNAVANVSPGEITVVAVKQGIKITTSKDKVIGMKVYYKTGLAPTTSSEYVYINGNAGIVNFEADKEGDDIYLGIKYMNGLWQESQDIIAPSTSHVVLDLGITLEKISTSLSASDGLATLVSRNNDFATSVSSKIGI